MKYFALTLSLILMINCSSRKTRRNFFYVESKYEIAPIKPKNLTYKKLQQMDKNDDGFINAKDFNKQRVVNNAHDIINSYVDYLNNYRAYDVEYGKYLDIDITRDGKISRFETTLYSLRKQGKTSSYLKLLQTIKVKNLIDFLRTRFTGLNYFGKVIESQTTGKVLAEEYSKKNRINNFRLINSKISIQRIIKGYNFKVKSSRYLPEMVIASPLVNLLKTEKKALELIIRNSKALFPQMFYSRNLMLAFISKIQSNLYEKEKKLNKKADKELIKDINLSFNNLDIIYAYITPLKNLESFHFDIVEKYKKELNSFIQKTNLKIKDYKSARALLKRFILENRILKYRYHFAIAALFKLKIKNKKPLNETDVSFSPDTMFNKGYGVCADQSIAFNIFMKDLLGINSGKIYLWFRKHYWNHLSMIYKSYGNYFVFDNYGINRLQFSSLKKAVRFHCKSSYKFIGSEKIDSKKAKNKSWQKVETGKSRLLSTSDGKIRIVFGSTEKCE